MLCNNVKCISALLECRLPIPQFPDYHCMFNTESFYRYGSCNIWSAVYLTVKKVSLSPLGHITECYLFYLFRITTKMKFTGYILLALSFLLVLMSAVEANPQFCYEQCRCKTVCPPNNQANPYNRREYEKPTKHIIANIFLFW